MKKVVSIEKKRITSTKTRIKFITSGQFIKQEGYNPSYILANNGQRLSRVRVLATVVDKFGSESGKFAAVTLDDGTDTIRAKVFNAVSMLEGVESGDIIDVFGRVKEYNGEVYLAPELITKSDANVELLRELELREHEKLLQETRNLILQYRNQTSDVAELSRIMKERHGIDEEVTEAMLKLSEQPFDNKTEDSKNTILGLIEKLDTGDGCNYSDLLEASKLPEEQIDTIVREVLEEGACFEPKPGKIKRL